MCVSSWFLCRGHSMFPLIFFRWRIQVATLCALPDSQWPSHSQLKVLMRQFPTEYNLSAIHLVLFCPASITLFLGQRMNALGEVITYEWTVDGAYLMSVG